MEIYLLDKDFQITSMPMEDFSSFTWTESWTEPGRFTLYADFAYFPEIAKSRYLYNTEAKKAAVIETVSYKAAAGERVVLGGRTLEALLERRVADAAFQSKMGMGVEEAAAAVFLQYADPAGARSLEGMTVEVSGETAGETVELSTAPGDNLMEWMYASLNAHGYAPEVVCDPDAGTLCLTFRRFTDRTVGNTAGNSPILLSQSFENTKDDAYAYDETELINHAYVVVEADPCYGKMVVEVDTRQEEEARVETYVESRVSSEPEKVGDALVPTVTLAECKAAMQQEGQEALEGQAIQENVSCQLERQQVYAYRRDFFVGDQVSYTSTILGVEMNAQLTTVTETYEKGGKRLDVQIGRDFSAVNYLRRMVRKQRMNKRR